MSALTDRITAVLELHRPYGLDCKCGEAINSDAWWAAHAAEQVVALFTEETRWEPDEGCWVKTFRPLGWTAVEPKYRTSNWPGVKKARLRRALTEGQP